MIPMDTDVLVTHTPPVGLPPAPFPPLPFSALSSPAHCSQLTKASPRFLSNSATTAT